MWRKREQVIMNYSLVMTTRDRTQEPEQQFAILLAMKDGNYACLIAVLLFIANGM